MKDGKRHVKRLKYFGNMKDGKSTVLDGSGNMTNDKSSVLRASDNMTNVK